MQRLDLPAAGDEPSGEEVQQLGVGGLAAHEAEVARGVHEADTEVVMPEAVREDAGGDRIILRDPVGQGHATFAFVGVDLERVGLGHEVEHAEAGRRDLRGGLRRVAAFLHEGGLGFRLMGADPGGRQLGDGCDALVDGGEGSAQLDDALGLRRCGDLLADAFEGVGRRPGLAVVGVGDLLPLLAVQGDEHLVLAGRGALGVVAEQAALGGAVGESADLLDAGQGDDEFRGVADEPLGPFVAVDRQGGAVGRGEVFRGGAFGAFRLGAVGGEGDVARGGFVGPDLELGDTAADAAERIGRRGGHGELDVSRLGRADPLLGQEGVRLRARIPAGGEQGLGLGLDGLGQGVLLRDDLGAFRVQRSDGRVVGLGLLRGRQGATAMDHAFEGRTDAVIILRGNRVELMVMTTGAVDGEPEEGAAGRGDHVVKRGGSDDLLGVGVLVADVVVGAGDEEGAADLDLRRALAERVAGEVFAHQLVEGLVFVQRADDVVAERVEVVDDEITFEAVALAEAYHIEPVPAPLFAVTR